jgi:hypothetical protein
MFTDILLSRFNRYKLYLIFVVGSSLQTGSNKEDSSFGRNLFDQQISPKSKKKKNI